MAMRETGKQRKSRIPPDYFKRADPLTRWKVALTLAAVGLAVVWWGSGWLRGGDIGRLRYSRGPLANVHAMWDANCSACHQPMTPIDSKSWLASHSDEMQSSDRRCQTCHAGPKHHQTEIATDTPSCAHCHREHRGRDASLVRMPNAGAVCIQCHTDLQRHTENGQTTFARKVTGFHIDHPEFKAVREGDPGKLHFSHARHLTAGMPLVTSDGKVPEGAVKIWKYGDIPDEAETLRYWKQQHPDAITIPPDQLTTPVQLDCASCHRLDGDDFAVSESKRHAAGLHKATESTKTMLPITYENQCQACHALTFEEGDLIEAVPHGLQVTDVQKFLDGVFVRRFLTGKQPAVPPSSPRPMPGRMVSEDPQTARDFIDKQIKDAERYLLQSEAGCKRCHGDQKKPLESIEPTHVPDSWFKHAIFDHAAHRAMDCLSCHEKAKQSTSEADVLLPGSNVCQNCHAPKEGSRNSARGGARFDCTECHRYHNGDFPHQGIGAAARSASRQATELSEFLRGSIPHGDRQSAPAP